MRTAFLIGGVKSGSGKTLVTLSLMAALRKRGLAVQPFKCGPDYIDPTLHQLVTGQTSSNLDLKMCGESFCNNIFKEKATLADICVVEGVMGLFDGGEASSASLAKSLNLPVILIIDVRSVAESVAAVLHGFETYDKELNIVGVIFNFTGSDRHKELIKNEVERNCKTQLLGFLPRDEKLSVPSRHLGLYMGNELKEQLELDKMVELVETHIDIDTLLKQCHYRTVPAEKATPSPFVIRQTSVRLAVARDEAFCFYYQDNLDMLEKAGVEIRYFSPVHDSDLPEDIQGIYFGGGYPEIYAERLSANGNIISQIRGFNRDRGYIYGECGGFMYLCDDIVDEQGAVYPMLGLIHTRVRMDKKLRKLGYREVRLHSDCMLGDKGDVRYGHEYHYSEEESLSRMLPPLFENDNDMYGYENGNCIGSYVHLHFGRTPEICQKIYEALVKRKKQRC